MDTDPELAGAGLDPRDFSFRGSVVRAKVVSVYDGDTVRLKWRPATRDSHQAAATGHPGGLIQWSCRLYGYDSPEMKPSLALPDRAAAIERAHAAAAALRAEIGPSGLVDAVLLDFDKYGRVLCELYRPGDVVGSAAAGITVGGTAAGAVGSVAPTELLPADAMMSLRFPESINSWMILNGHGYPYSGGKKKA